jgi:tetratricopeptide (TPR) repeat protein
VQGPFAVLASALRQNLSISSAQSPEHQRQTLAGSVRALFGEGDADAVVVFLGELMGVRFSDEDHVPLRAARSDSRLMGDQIRNAWLAWLRAVTQHRPVLVVLEDLHWSDWPSVQLVGDALGELRDAPLMVLASSREDLHERLPGLWSGTEVTEIRLAPLADRAARRLVLQALGDETPEETVQALLRRAGGNAFFLEELMRAYAEGSWSWLPSSLLGMIQSRLDTLDTDARRVLRAASIYGGPFTERAVQALVGGPERDALVREWLQHLVDREIIRPRGASGPPSGEPEFVFRHELVREAAYATLTEPDRRLGHRLAASWLEARGASESATLGMHFELGEQYEQAARWYTRAAEETLQADDLDTSLRLADRALRCGADDEARGALHLLQAEVYRWKDDIVRAQRCAGEAVERIVPGTAQWFRAVSEHLVLSGVAGDHERLLGGVQSLEATSAEGPRAERQRLRAVCRGASQLVMAGQYALADRLLQTASGGDTDDDPVARARLQRTRAHRALHGGYPADALEHCMRARERFELAGDRRNACLEGVSEGQALLVLGAYERARARLEAAIEQAPQMGVAYPIHFARVLLSRVLACEGELQAARRMAEQALDWFAERGGARLEGVSRLYLGDILWQAQQPEAAEPQFRRAAHVLRAFPPRRAQALGALADVQLRLDRPVEALETARGAAELLGRLQGIPEGESRIRLVYGLALRSTGDVGFSGQVLRDGAARLRVRAQAIEEPTLRESYLGGVPDNARLLASGDRADAG